MSLHSQLNEEQNQYNLIDPLLVKADWNLADRPSVPFKIPFGNTKASVNSITNYCLFRDYKEVPAEVEAKGTERHQRVRKEQLLQYITKKEIKQSFYSFGFLMKDDSERLLVLQQICLLLPTEANRERKDNPFGNIMLLKNTREYNSKRVNKIETYHGVMKTLELINIIVYAIL